ncbi:putative phosphatidylserine decarboxylase [Calocera cornea HHB12733]|uniref:Putative phosphatidylserine decarboxylase n=1 Tax=Calocera cornea HHB12733 TaxID=1353952 RepID=A0A165JLB0_9BASI|nr:putative phosphatidylserine decarboxylase [Calocera cornea HHB12733]
MVQNRQVGWLTVNRKTGEFIREQQPLAEKFRLLLLFNPLLEWIDRTNMFRWWLHRQNDMAYKKEAKPESKKQIRPFIEAYKINMADFEPSDPDAYTTFYDFFIRKHTPSSRPLHAPDDPTAAVCAADCRLVVYETVAESHKIWIKGNHFSIAALILDKVAAKPWDNGAIASFRLNPQDYHRYHSPVAGTVKWWKELDGQYYSVDPLAITSSVDILTANARCAFCLASPEFGDVLFVAIGADEVGTVKLAEKAMTPGAPIAKGEEVGCFEFGGSSVVVAFEPGRIVFDQDLVEWSKKAVEVDVEVLSSLGRASAPGKSA